LILLDTHALLWLESGSERLGSRTRRLVDRALADEALGVSAITFWEIGMLIAKERLTLARPAERLRAELLGSGLVELPLTGDAALAAARLQSFHADPADRLIVATALASSATLVTADSRILDWPGRVKRQDARQ
jgi:PIN domain nuclease of toxin-antitoxin system